MSAITVGDARRGDVIRRMQRRILGLDAEIGRGSNGANGIQNEYLASRVNYLMGERDRLNAEIGRLNRLTDEELIGEFVPSVAQAEAIKDEPVPDFGDIMFGRGAMLPQQVVVHKEPLPVAHEGTAYPANPIGLPAGFVPGETYYPNYNS